MSTSSDTDDDRRVSDRGWVEALVAERTSELAHEVESLAYSVAHDLGAPLRAMDGFSLALLEDYGDRLDREGREHVERIRAASQRMASLLDGLLTISCAARTALHSQRVRLDRIAVEIADELQTAGPERDARFDIAAGLAATGDARLLRTVMANLMANAWKFTAREAITVIEVGAERVDGQRQFFVRDNGIGFDPAYAGRLFGAFQRLHPPDEFPGAGVGLATARRIIHRHGGRIWAHGAAGQGATFSFTLPDG